MSVRISEVEPGVFLVLQDGSVTEAHVDLGDVSIDGIRYTGLAADPRKWNPSAAAGQAQGRSALKSLMPGKIVRVLVSVGDAVVAGQGVLVIEAMKMQNEMKSARAGRVTAVHVQENDTVEAGALLAVIE